MNQPIFTKINLGCGQSPTPQWENFDNSFSVRIAHRPLLVRALCAIGMLNERQRAFIEFCRSADIRWANAAVRIPKSDHTVDVLYSSHMVEHLYKSELSHFLAEARRVLRPGGILRLALPDIRYHVDNYLASGDSDAFVSASGLGRAEGGGALRRAMRVVIGDRGHKWMYDGKGICTVLTAAGFEDAAVLPPGESSIPDPGALNLHERSPESVFVEAVNP